MSPEVYSQIWQIYEQAFPYEERRDTHEQQEIFKNKHYKILPYFNQDQKEVLGFIALWDLPEFTFIEHLAIKHTCRNQGLGKELIQKVQKQAKQKPLILEVEPPQTKLAKRRIGFYERVGFSLNKYPYKQPSYHAGGDSVSLCLMSFPIALSSEDFAKVRSTLYNHVYKQDVAL